MAWRARYGLGNHIPSGIENSGRKISCFPHHRGKAGAHERRSLFIGYGNQSVPQYFESYRIKGVLFHTNFPFLFEIAEKSPFLPLLQEGEFWNAWKIPNSRPRGMAELQAESSGPWAKEHKTDIAWAL
jgi:hypothetical protein